MRATDLTPSHAPKNRDGGADHETHYTSDISLIAIVRTV